MSAGTAMIKIKHIINVLTALYLSAFGLTGIALAEPTKKLLYEQGPYQIFNEQALEVLNLKMPLQILASGYEWLEGPVWVNQGGYLLYSDIPNHQVYKYTPGKGVSLYLAQSGYSNGLLVNAQNELVLLQSRSRVVSKMKAPLSAPKSDYLPIVSHFNGQKFNSPNDGAFNNKGTLYFSDPPYGLPKQLNDENKELSFQGVYSVKDTGEITLLDDELIYPNGVALSNDNKILYVAASNENKPAWYQYYLNSNGGVISKSLFYQLPPIAKHGKGLPDGLKVHKSGIIFATGPNGLWLFNKKAELLAKITTPNMSANLAFNTQQNRVYITAHTQLLALDLK